MSYTHMPLSARSKDFRIKTDGEYAWTANTSTNISNYGFTLKNPIQSTTDFHLPSSEAEYKIHDLGSLAITEGDYILDIEYLWRFQNQGGYSAIVNNYSSATATVLTLGRDNWQHYTDSYYTNNGTYSFLCNGTYTQIGSDISNSQTAVNTYSLKIEKKLKFRVEGNPIVPRWTNYNWGSYWPYSRGTQYDLYFQKFPLYSLS